MVEGIDLPQLTLRKRVQQVSTLISRPLLGLHSDLINFKVIIPLFFDLVLDLISLGVVSKSAESTAHRVRRDNSVLLS